MRVRGVLCVAAALAVLSCAGTGTAASTSTVGTIAYERGNTLYVVDATGTGTPVALATSAFTPDWSPDGKHLVYADAGGVEIVDADGTHRTTLVSGAGLWNPSWSPNGSAIAYVAAPVAGMSTPTGVFVVPAAGGSPTQLRAGTGFQSSATWSPDGTQIAFLEGATTANIPRIWVMDADGSSPHALVTADPPDQGGAKLRNLSWSPDGTELAYSTGAQPQVYGQGLRAASIAVVRPDGSHEHILIPPPPGPASSYTDPSWSPDGRSIIFSDSAMQGPNRPPEGLDIANADGTGMHQLLTG
jgi:Tol biopolymer transport system component